MLKIFTLVVALCFGDVCQRVESEPLDTRVTLAECQRILKYEKAKIEYLTEGEVRYAYCKEAGRERES